MVLQDRISGKRPRRALMLLWGVSVSCRGFALKSHHQKHSRGLLKRNRNLHDNNQHHYHFHDGKHPTSYLINNTNNNRKRLNPSTLHLHITRGGAIDSKSLREKTDDDMDHDLLLEVSREDLVKRRGMAMALAATYFTVMASKCALPAVLSQLTSPKIGLKYSSLWTLPHQVLFARLLALSTFAIAAGKILLGPVIDYFGGIFSLKIALSLLALLLGTISVASSFKVFAICWIVVDFIFSSCWAACINAIHQSFPDREWGKRIGMLAAAARTGNAAAFAFFAWILAVASNSMAQPWRIVFFCSAFVQIVPISLLAYFGRVPGPYTACSAANVREVEVNNGKEQGSEGYQEQKKMSMKASIAALRREAKTLSFWMHLLSRSLLMVFASFLLFVPLLMSQVYGASDSIAAQVGSIYALGCLLSVTFGSNLYAKLNKKYKAMSVALLLGVSTLSSAAQLGHMLGRWQLSTLASAVSLFFWGFSFAIPFYIPPSLYALARGGVESSATIADVFDIGGFGLLAIFNGYVASIAHANASAWIPTLQLTTGCSALSLISLTIAILYE